jgi:hypothetical protein
MLKCYIWGGAVVKENMEIVAYPFPDPESFSWTLDTSIIKAYHDWHKRDGN